MDKFTIKDLLCSKYFVFLFTLNLLLSSCYIDNIPYNDIIEYIAIGLAIAIIILYIINMKFSKLSICLICFLISLLISTLISNTASVEMLFKSFIKVIALSFFIEWTIKDNVENVVKGIYYTLYILIFVNFMTIIIYPGGLYSASYKFNWFLGYDNTHIFWYIPALVLAFINLEIKNKKMDIGTIVLLGIISYSVYYCFSANSVVAYTILLIYLLFSRYIDKLEWMNAKNYFKVFIIFFLLFVILRVQNIFSWLIVDILHKDLTFTGRTIVWTNAMQNIKENWFFGYGVEKPQIISEKLGNAHYVHAHNTILDVIYKGGIIAFIPFVMYIYITILELFKNRNKKIAKKVSLAVFTILIMMLFEARENSFGFYIIFSIGYNIKYICELIEKKRRRLKDEDK